MTRDEFIQRAAIKIAVSDPSFSPAAIANALRKAAALADAVGTVAEWSGDVAAAIGCIGPAEGTDHGHR